MCHLNFHAKNYIFVSFDSIWKCGEEMEISAFRD